MRASVSRPGAPAFCSFSAMRSARDSRMTFCPAMPVGERGRGRVDPEPEHVQRAAAPDDRQLDPGDEADARGRRLRGGGGDAVHGVVIGERHQLDAAAGDVRDERRRIEHAVRSRRVQVQVDFRVRAHAALGPSPTVLHGVAGQHDEAATAAEAVLRVIEHVGASPGRAAHRRRERYAGGGSRPCRPASGRWRFRRYPSPGGWRAHAPPRLECQKPASSASRATASSIPQVIAASRASRRRHRRARRNAGSADPPWRCIRAAARRA